MLGIDLIWWVAAGLVVVAVALVGFCALILGARIGDDMEDVQINESTVRIAHVCPNCVTEWEHLPLDDKCPLCRKELRRVDKDAWEARKIADTSSKSPVETSRPKHDAAADRVHEEPGELAVYRDALEVIGFVTTDPRSRDIAHSALEKRTKAAVEKALARSSDSSLVDLVEVQGPLAVRDRTGEVGDYVIRIDQQVMWRGYDRLEDDRFGDDWRRGRVLKFYLDKKASSEAEDPYFVRVMDEQTGRMRTVPSHNVRPLTRGMWS